MTNKPDGVSAETVEAVAKAIDGWAWPIVDESCPNLFDSYAQRRREAGIKSRQAITALLASGEVVLRKDVEELVNRLQNCRNAIASLPDDALGIVDHDYDQWPLKKEILHYADGTLAKFTTKQEAACS